MMTGMLVSINPTANVPKTRAKTTFVRSAESVSARAIRPNDASKSSQRRVGGFVAEASAVAAWNGKTNAAVK